MKLNDEHRMIQQNIVLERVREFRRTLKGAERQDQALNRSDSFDARKRLPTDF